MIGQSLVHRFLPSVVYLRQGLQKATEDSTHQQVQLPANKQAGSKLAMPIKHKNEKSGQAASRALVHHSTSQR